MRPCPAPLQVGIASFGTDLPDTVSEEELLKVRGAPGRAAAALGGPAGRAGAAEQRTAAACCSAKVQQPLPPMATPHARPLCNTLHSLHCPSPTHPERNPRSTTPPPLQVVADYNADPSVHGILVQLPLPKHIDEQRVLDAISIEKVRGRGGVWRCVGMCVGVRGWASVGSSCVWGLTSTRGGHLWG